MMEENENIVSTPTIEPEKKPNNIMAVGAIVVIAVVILGYAFINKGASEEISTDSTDARMEDTDIANSNTGPQVEGASSSTAPISTANGVTTITMEAGSFYYKPNQITVKKGDKVKVVLSSQDMMHNFNIDELNVKSSLVKEGETSTVEFTADKVGSFEFYCAVGEHRKRGQVGTLTVTE